tara:strand:+ start:345 stop:1280 length:936 start_codon:yes stop_codon:yes gene_type:complete
MATIFYDKAPVEIQTLGPPVFRETLLASDCSVNFSNSTQPLYSVGRKGPLGQFPAGPRVGDISFNFLTSITGTFQNIKDAGSAARQGNIINYLADAIKRSPNSETSGVIVKCAGVSGVGFLNSYSFNVAANSISSSSASFSLFGSGDALPVSGRLTGIDVGVGAAATANQITSGIVHGRRTTMPPALATSIAAPGTISETATIYGADYSISFNHNPIYKIGQEFPSTTLYTTAAESLNVTEDLFNSGLAFDETAASYTLELKSLVQPAAQGLGYTTNPMKVRVTDAKQISTSATAGLDDIIRTQKTLTAAY